MAGRLGGDFVVDAFTGAGGNAVQLAAACAAVLAIDTSAPRLAAAAHNAALYGVRGRLDLVVGDVLTLLPRVRNVRSETSRVGPERVRGRLLCFGERAGAAAAHAPGGSATCSG